MYDKNWYESLNKSSITPPSWVFRVVWPILYLFMFLSFFIIKKNPKCIAFCSPLYFFLIQLGFNLLWTTLFFKMKQPKLALLDLVLTIVFTFITILQFKTISNTSVYLLIPYLVWICFALYLNFYIVMKN